MKKRAVKNNPKSFAKHIMILQIQIQMDEPRNTGFRPILSETVPPIHAPIAKPKKYDIVGNGNNSLLLQYKLYDEEYEYVPFNGNSY